MQITNLRGSSYNTYTDCQWLYALLYDYNFHSYSGLKSTLGSVVHLALELLAKAKKCNHHINQPQSKFLNPKYLLKVSWNRLINKQEPHVKKDKNYNKSVNKKFCLEQICTVLNTKFNPLLLEIIETELQFEIEIRKPGFQTEFGDFLKIRGTIDLITKFDENTIEVIDYKTGLRKDWNTGEVKEMEHLEDDIQFLIYNLAIRTLFPQYPNINFTVFFTQENKPISFAHSLEDTDLVLSKLRQRFIEIKNNDIPKRLKDDRKRYKEHFKCKYVCHFGKTKDQYGQSLCDKYHQMSNGQLYQVSMREKSKENLVVSKRNNYSNNRIYRAVIQ